MNRTALLKAIRLAAMACALAAAPAQAEVRILESPGGEVGPFLDLFEKVRASGERVVIDGPCLSACTLVLSMVPSERICVTRRALDRPAWPALCRAGSLPAGAGGLSRSGQELDHPPWRIDVAPVVAARARARRDVSEMPIGCARSAMALGRIAIALLLMICA